MKRKVFLMVSMLGLIACGQQNTSSYSPLQNECSVQKISPSTDVPYGGTLVLCGYTKSLITNGSTSVYSILEVIDPCGPTPSIYNEVLLRLANNQLLALFADNVNGYNPRLAIIPPGSYMTTDGSSCYFNIDANNNVTW